MLNAKLRKLVRDPNLFLSDMIKNKKRKIGKYHLKKEEGHYSYTLVTAVYNVGRYLDDFFKSLVAQKLDFNNHIKLIMVDDGSTDNSAMIIKRWVKKYPNNISYVWKENGGQSSARNLGLEYVTTDWVTFVDPDDFLDSNYFYNIDGFLYKNKDKNLSMLGCNVVFYFEKNKFYKESHPLGFKFKNGDVCVPIDKIGKNIQLSASTAIFKTSLIQEHYIRFDPEVKPAFEDAKFVQEYLLDVGDSSVGFLRDSKYYYRKREDGTSTLDTAWQKVERFTTTPKYGYLKIIEKCYSNYGYVPEYIQRTLIYEISWHLKWLLNHQERAFFLTDDQKNEYIYNLKEVFKHIDKKTIINFELSGCWFFHKVGLISFFKNEDPEAQIIYLEKYDSYKKLVQIRYFSREIGFESFTIDGKDVTPVFAKKISHDFLGHELVIERRAWFKIDNGNKINFRLSNVPTRLSLAGKQSTSGVAISDIVKHFNSIIPQYKKVHKYNGSWLLMDRDTQADDNAEHLYRYIRDHRPEQRIFFVLRKDSHDWERLKNDGFNLLDFSSHEHELAMQSCSKIISSHADKYVTNYLGPRMLEGRHYVFLQHGVTKDDISNWLNQKENIDCLITASPYEYNSFVDDGTRYFYNQKEVALTGFPRHDKLVRKSNECERLIIIMPTWRNSIVGSTVSEGNIRQLNPDFMKTKFATCWYSFIHSNVLKELSDKYNFKIAFFPHANIQPYLPLFETPDYIEIISHTSGSIQNIFNRAAMMITDYSSVAFEMAVQNKQTIYYQFDEDEIYSGGHFYSKGYFDYREDGFGPVVNDEESLLNELALILENNAEPSEFILNKIEKTFPYRDGRNCERVYEAISDLDSPLGSDFCNQQLVKEFANMASINKRWGIAAERWSSVISVQNDIDTEAVFRLIEALTEQGKIKQAEEVISYAEANVEYVNDRNLIESSALIFMAKHQWLAAIECWEKLSKGTICNAKYCICLASSRQFDKLSLLVNDNVDLDVFVKLCLFMANEQWESITELEELESLYNSDPSKVRAECFLIKAHAYNRMSQVDLAHSMLVKYESIIQNNPQCRYEIARLAYATKNWGKLIKQLNINCPDVISLPLEFIKYYLEALTYQGKHQTVDGYLNTLYSEGVYSEAELSSIFMETSLCASILNKLEVAEARLEKCISSFNYCDVTCYTTLIDVTIKQGKLERSSELLSYALKFYSVEEQTLLYKCKAILNMLMHNWSDAILSWKAYSESPADNTLYLLSAAYSHQTDLLRGLLGGDEQMDVFINLLIEFSESNWQEFIDGYTRANEGGYIDLQLFKSILILLASASREIGDYSDAHKYLVSYESLVANDPLCRFEIAKLAFSQNNFNKGLQQLKLTSIDPQWFPTELKEIYLKCLFEKGDHNGVDDELVRFIEHDFTEGCQLLNVLSLESFRDKKWNLAELRYKKYISLQNNICIDEAQNLIFSLIKQNKLAEAESFISSILNSEDDSLIHKVVESRAMLRMAQHRWAEAIKDWRSIGMDNGDNLYYCQCLCWLKDSYLLSEVLNDSDSSLPDYNKIVLLSFIHISNESWQLFILLMKNNGIVDLISEQSLDLGLLILMSMAYRKMNNFDDANKCLVMFESKVKNDIQCRFEITRLSISCKRWSKALAQLNMISSNVGDLPVEFRYYYLYSLFNLGDYLQMSAVFNSLTIEENKCWDFNLLKMKMLMKLERWADALNEISFLEQNDENIYDKALILRHLGEFKSAFDCLANYRFIDTIEYWSLRGDLAQLNDDWTEFYKCSLRIRGKKSGDISIQSSDIDSLVNLRMIQNK